MNVKQTIEQRRAYRSLDPVEITEELVDDLGHSIQLSPSCFNNEPWRYVFVYDKPILDTLKEEALSRGNAWAKNSSMIIAVFAKEKDDCVIHERVYDLFDTGMATGFMVLRAWELGLVAHPIAGFHSDKVRDILQIPNEYDIITLVIVGKKAEDIKPELSEKQVAIEAERPKRFPIKYFVHRNVYKRVELDEEEQGHIGKYV